MCFLMNFAQFVTIPILQNTTRRLLLMIAVSVVVRGELANETVNYNTETGAYQFKQEVPVMKKCSPGQKTGLTLVRRSLINARFN